MNDFFTALQIYVKLQTSCELLTTLQEKYELTKKDLAGLRKFYEQRNLIFYDNNEYDYDARDEQADTEDVDDDEADDDETYVGNIASMVIAPKNTYTSLIEKIESPDVLNASLMARYNEISDDAVNPFQRESLVPVIDKKYIKKLTEKNKTKDQNQQSGTEELSAKLIREKQIQEWIDFICKREIVQFTIKKGINRSVIAKPLGLYQPDGTDRVKVIFQDVKSKEIAETDITNIRYGGTFGMSKVTSPKTYSNLCETFEIDEYLNNKPVKEVIARVYKPDRAHVLDKLKKVFGDKLEEETDTEKFHRVCIKVDDPMDYLELFSSYGRSVAIEEPAELREEIINEKKRILNFYYSLEDEIPK